MGFSGLSIGLSSLLAQQRAMEVTGHNLANVSTEGYSRQRVEMHSDSGPVTPALFSRYEGTGMGVQSGSITRLRDQFLELRGYQEHAADTRARQVQTTLQRVEGAFGEPSDTGLAAQLADYWAAWDDVANRPDDLSARSQLIERAKTLTASFRQTDGALRALRSSTIDQLSATVDEVNATAARIADLNHTIQSALNANLNANDLLDQRDRLVAQLADRVGVTVRNGESGTIDVFVGGTALVRGTKSETLAVRRVGPDPDDTVTVNWTKDNLPATVSGTAGGMLDAVDPVNGIVNRYRAQLDAVAESLRTETNTVHAAAYDLDGTTGVDFFVNTPAGIDVNPALDGHPERVAASATAGTYDGSKAAQLAASADTDSTYRQVVVGLGVEAQSANRRVEIQGSITEQIDTARDAQSGVSLDEEMTNLVAYQHAYSAAAKFIQAVDEMLDVLVNQVGR